MNFLDLPEEVVLIILNYLDTESKINAYNSCSSLREFYAPRLVKKVVLSRSVIASMKTFSEELLLKMGSHVKELNLSGVPDLTAASLKPHINSFPHLKTLDITFTDIYLPDLIDICPEYLKEISVNFFQCPRKSRRDSTWNNCKELFKSREFEKIHFIVFEFLDSDIPLTFLKGVPMIHDLQITVADNYKDFWDEGEEEIAFDRHVINFSKLYYLFRECRVSHTTSKYLRGVANLHYAQVEYIYIMYLEKILIYVSPVFKSLFHVSCRDLRVEVSPYLPLDFMLDGNIVFKAWNKSTTTFDSEFLRKVSMDMKDYFPSYICQHSLIRMNITNAPSDWYCVDVCKGFEKLPPDLPCKVTLTDFCRKNGTVTLYRRSRLVSLTFEPNTWKNITYLRLSTVLLKEESFNVLFLGCFKLETLDLNIERRGRLGFKKCTKSLFNFIHLAKRLKNVKMTSEKVKYEVLFHALSRCRTLENVHICEYDRVCPTLNEVDVRSLGFFIESCEKLYSVFIEADRPPECLTLLTSPLRDAAQRLGREHLSIEVCDCYRGWNPFADVFNPSPLHILE